MPRSDVTRRCQTCVNRDLPSDADPCWSCFDHPRRPSWARRSNADSPAEQQAQGVLDNVTVKAKV